MGLGIRVQLVRTIILQLLGFAASWVLDLHGHEIVYGIMCLDIVHPRILVQNAVFVKQQIPAKRSWSPSSAST